MKVLISNAELKLDIFNKKKKEKKVMFGKEGKFGRNKKKEEPQVVYVPVPKGDSQYRTVVNALALVGAFVIYEAVVKSLKG